MPVVEILNPEIVQDLKQVGKIEQREIQPVIAFGQSILHREVDTENKKRLDQDIDQDQEQDVEEKLALHGGKGMKRVSGWRV